MSNARLSTEITAGLALARVLAYGPDASPATLAGLAAWRRAQGLLERVLGGREDLRPALHTAVLSAREASQLTRQPSDVQPRAAV